MDSPGPALVVQNRGLTMTDSNANNLYLRHGYQAHLREAKGVDPKTIDLVVSAIEDFDISIEHCDYLRLTKAISLEYKTRLSKRASKSSGQPLARGTIVRRLGHIAVRHRRPGILALRRSIPVGRAIFASRNVLYGAQMA